MASDPPPPKRLRAPRLLDYYEFSASLASPAPGADSVLHAPSVPTSAVSSSPLPAKVAVYAPPAGGRYTPNCAMSSAHRYILRSGARRRCPKRRRTPRRKFWWSRCVPQGTDKGHLAVASSQKRKDWDCRSQVRAANYYHGWRRCSEKEPSGSQRKWALIKLT